MEPIDKSAIMAEIKRKLQDLIVCKRDTSFIEHKVVLSAKIDMCKEILSILDNLEVKEVDTWHLQEKENIYDAVKDWGLYKFACIMKDGTIQRFNGCLDEDCEGHISTHIDGVNDDYDNVDDIVKWIKV